jgi:hypothetical protein
LIAQLYVVFFCQKTCNSNQINANFLFRQRNIWLFMRKN